MSEEEKKIEIVSGNVKDLEISPVYEHLSVAKPNTNTEKKNIVIPEVKKTRDDEEDDDEEDKDEETQEEEN